MDDSKQNEKQWKLYQVKNAKILLPILKDRLPNSCYVYNMAIKCNEFSSEMSFYTLGKEIHNGSWIVSTFVREDYGLDLNISNPASKENIEEMKNALLETNIIPWTEPHMFHIGQDISPMIRNLCVDIKRNKYRINPHIIYYSNPEDCLKAETEYVKKAKTDSDVEIKSMEKESGIEFFRTTWKYAKNSSECYFNKILDRNDSTGVFVKGVQVSGIVVSGGGLMSMLYTHEKYRNKGLGKLCMLHQMRKMAKNGLIPCSSVECTNEASKTFHESVGMKIAHYIDFYTFSEN